MKPKTALWAGLAVLALVILCYCLPSIQDRRVKAHRFQGVNTLRFAASTTLTNTNAPAPAAPGDRK